MDSQMYWRNRETEQRKHDIRDEREYQRRIEEIYQNMINEIEKEINGFYGKYARRCARLNRGKSIVHFVQKNLICFRVIYR